MKFNIILKYNNLPRLLLVEYETLLNICVVKEPLSLNIFFDYVRRSEVLLHSHSNNVK